jgi:hypothetical protein
MIQEKVLM